MVSDSTIQAAKRVVLDYYDALECAQGEQIKVVFDHYVAPSYCWRGFHPFNEQRDPKRVAELFWIPLKESLTRLQRRMDIFIGGYNQIDDFSSTWVVSMGHLMGLFDSPWLGIPSTQKIAMLRYCEFHRVENGKICETAMFFDLPHLMQQAGVQAFPNQTGSPLVQPGPMTHDGLCFEPQDGEEGKKTLGAINAMINDVRDWQQAIPIEQELARTWNDDMIWWGPAGIGATYTIERYAKQHAGPFREGFADRSFNGHICRLAESSYGGFFGWPNLTLTPTGGFMGMPATNKPGDMRVIDMYRREGDKLTENWIFIDLLHFWNQQGLDVLGRLDAIGSGGAH